MTRIPIPFNINLLKRFICFRSSSILICNDYCYCPSTACTRQRPFSTPLSSSLQSSEEYFQLLYRTNLFLRKEANFEPKTRFGNKIFIGSKFSKSNQKRYRQKTSALRRPPPAALTVDRVGMREKSVFGKSDRRRKK